MSNFKYKLTHDFYTIEPPVETPTDTIREYLGKIEALVEIASETDFVTFRSETSLNFFWVLLDLIGRAKSLYDKNPNAIT